MKSKLISFGTIAVLTTIFLFAFPGVIAAGYSSNSRTAPSLYPGPTHNIHIYKPSQIHNPATAPNCTGTTKCEYVTDIGTNLLYVFKGKTLAYTITLCSIQIGAAYDPANGMVYVGDYGCGQVDVINAATQAITTSITGVCGPADVVYSTLGNDIFVGGFGCGLVTVINPSSNTITTTVATCSTYPEWGDQLKGGDVYFASRYSCADAINPTTNTVQYTATVGSCATGMTVNQKNKEVYVADSCNGNVYVLTKKLVPVMTLSGFTSGLWDGFYAPATFQVMETNYAGFSVTPINYTNIVLSPITGLTGEPNSGCGQGSASFVPSYYTSAGTPGLNFLKLDSYVTFKTISGAAYPFSCTTTPKGTP